MEISYGKQIDIIEITGEIDLFLFAGNHEKRVFSCFNYFLQKNKIDRSITLCYKDSFCLAENHCGKKLVISDLDDIYGVLDTFFLNNKKDEVTIAIDYSCMTKSWYYSIILYLSKKKINVKAIKSYFIYTPSKYSEPQDPKPNTEIAPLPGKYVVPTDKPKALIVCLGYEQNKAEGIIDHLDPKISYLFYTKPALDESFVSKLESNNKSILLEKADKVITYPFDDLLFLEQKLTAIYYKLKDDYSIIIAPLGPKPFSFISMVMSMKYNDIDIWRVGSGSDINEYEREPLEENHFIVSEILFEN